MSRLALALGAAGIALALQGPAEAQDTNHPQYLPTRDVAVTYRLTGGPAGASQAQTTHMYYSAAAGKLRIDTPNDAGFTVLDRNAGTQTLVMNQDRAYAVTQLPPGAADGFILNNQMSYQRQGARTIDNLACTNWSVSSQQTTGSACVTDDGVLLAGDGRPQGAQGPDGQDGQTSLVAVNVDYAPQPASLFVPPPGFRKLSEQEMQQMEQAEAPQGGGPQGGPPDAGQYAPPPGYAPPNGNGQ